jgi:DNA-binding NtrC family response regulator
MELHQFLTTHREQLERACRSERGGSNDLQRLRQCLLSFFADTAPELVPESISAPRARPALIGSSPQMTRLRSSVAQLSRRSRASVLVLGETGTGRRQCARSLHAATYPEGELFELARVDQLEELVRRVAALRIRASSSSAAGLTVYVHELSEASPTVQFALSRLIREQSLQLRIIASSRRVLEHACREGLVRADLVSGFSNVLEVPPLRNRVSDIPELARHFAELSATRRKSQPTLLSQLALQRLQEYPWLGNLSELNQFIDKLSEQLGPGLVEPEALPEIGARPSAPCFVLPPTGIDFAELERLLLVQALAMARNNRTRAASLLGLTRDQIRYRLLKFEIQGGGPDSD